MKKIVSCFAWGCLLALGACASDGPTTTTTMTTNERRQPSASMREVSAQSDTNPAMQGPPR